MTEKEFNQKIENMASQLEQKIEIVAEHLDKGITQNTNKAVCSGLLQEELLWQQKLVF